MCSVITNFLLLYFSNMDISFFGDEEGQTGKLWTIILMISTVMFIKFLFRQLIPDKPKWVLEE